MITKVKQTPVAKSASEYKTRFEDFPEDYDEAPDYSPVIIVSNSRSTFSFNFDCEKDAFCCGVYSLGEFSVNNTPSIPETRKIAAIKEGVGKFVNIMKEGGEEITLMFTLVENPACNMLGKALADGKLFTKVKSFKNLNSQRINHMYISN